MVNKPLIRPAISGGGTWPGGAPVDQPWKLVFQWKGWYGTARFVIHPRNLTHGRTHEKTDPEKTWVSIIALASNLLGPGSVGKVPFNFWWNSAIEMNFSLLKCTIQMNPLFFPCHTPPKSNELIPRMMGLGKMYLLSNMAISGNYVRYQRGNSLS